MIAGMDGVVGAPRVFSDAKAKAIVWNNNKAAVHVGAVQRKNRALGQASGKSMLIVIIKS